MTDYRNTSLLTTSYQSLMPLEHANGIKNPKPIFSLSKNCNTVSCKNHPDHDVNDMSLWHFCLALLQEQKTDTMTIEIMLKR